MKKLTSILLLLWATAGFLCAQSPYLINYQAVLRDGSGNLVTTGTVNLGISIHDAITGGNNLYQETHSVSPNPFGIANVKIGAGTVQSGNFNTIDWSSGDKYIQIYYNGGPLGTRNQLVSVPFAIHANNGVPAGTIMAYGGTAQNIPNGWKLCDGATISRSQYASLFAVSGTQFGSGDGVSTFHLPDLRGRFLRGVAGATNLDPDAATRTAMNTGGSMGNQVGSVQGDAFQSHNHGVNDPGHNHMQNFQGSGGNPIATMNSVVGGNGVVQPTNVATENNVTGISIQSAGGSSETRPENAYVLYIIKY